VRKSLRLFVLLHCSSFLYLEISLKSQFAPEIVIAVLFRAAAVQPVHWFLHSCTHNFYSCIKPDHNGPTPAASERRRPSKGRSVGAIILSLSTVCQSKDQWTNLYVMPHTSSTLTLSQELTLRMGTLLVKIVKVLGEGGFSFVYLCQDEHSGVSSVAYVSSLLRPLIRIGFYNLPETICVEED
jgi:hypothetical protein